MDKRYAYEGELPRHIDFMEQQRMVQRAIGHLIHDMLFSSAELSNILTLKMLAGFKLYYPGNLTIQVGPGRLYEYAVLEDADFGDIGDDETMVFQQGIYEGATVAVAAPGSDSRWSLLQVRRVELDDNEIQIGYYNADNPSVALMGPGGSGATQPLDRRHSVELSVKHGATSSGEPVKPSPDAGYEALLYVKLAAGQTTIFAGDTALPETTSFLHGLYFTKRTGVNGAASQLDLAAEVTGVLPLANITADVKFNDVAGMVPGIPDANTKVFIFPVVRAFSLAASLSGSYATAETAPTDDPFVFTVKKVTAGGVETTLGTITFAVGSKVGVFAGTGGTLAATDRIIVVTQSVADSTLADVAFCFKGVLV